MPTHFQRSDVTIGQVDQTIRCVPEDKFFSDRDAGILRTNTLPLPEGAGWWKKARFMGEDVHVTESGDYFFMLADTTVFGYCLFKFVSSPEDDSTLQVAYQGGNRIITNERSNIMSMNLNQLASDYQRAVNPMNLGGMPAQTPAPAMSPVGTAGEGISGSTEYSALCADVLVNGYVAGYVMGNAPQVSMSLKTVKNDTQNPVQIKAKESRPSRCLSVLLAIPTRCILKKNALATPTDILSGQVDWDRNNNEMTYMPFDEQSAITYIYAFGGRMTEYAPHVINASKQWTKDQIQGGADEVSFVYLRPTNKGAVADPNKLRYVLKTTSPRGCLYTEKNIVCLRAVKHISTDVKSEKDAYELNESAFGSWRYRNRPGSTSEKMFDYAHANCPNVLWNQTYEIDGEKKDGIGSCFFMAGPTATTESGAEVAPVTLNYRPWNSVYRRTKGAVPPEEPLCKAIIYRKRGTKKDGSATMSTVPIYLKDNPNSKDFSCYANFINFILQHNFMTREALYNMGSRASKAKSKFFVFDNTQREQMLNYLNTESAQAAIAAVRQEYANRTTPVNR